MDSIMHAPRLLPHARRISRVVFCGTPRSALVSQAVPPSAGHISLEAPISSLKIKQSPHEEGGRIPGNSPELLGISSLEADNTTAACCTAIQLLRVYNGLEVALQHPASHLSMRCPADACLGFF